MTPPQTFSLPKSALLKGDMSQDQLMAPGKDRADSILQIWASVVSHESFLLYGMLVNFGLCGENLKVRSNDYSEASLC